MARLRASLAGRLAGMALLAVVAQGCAEKPPPPPPEPPPPPPPHAGPPPAAFCSVAPFTVKTGGSADVRMIVSHEGGYCAATLVADSGQPYDAPLVPVPSLHGIPRVVRYAGKTSVEYAPQPGFVGHDNFVAQLIVRGQPGYTTLNVSVTVQ
jgi:hypothetical protein